MLSEMQSLMTRSFIYFETNTDSNAYSQDLTALHVSCQTGNLEAISMLLDKGADPGSKDKRGVTPLHDLFRCRFANTKDVEKLLDGLSDAIEEGSLLFN